MYKLTEAIKNNHLRGKALADKFSKEPNQILKSTDELSLDEVKQLYTFLNKQQYKYEPNKRLYDGSISKGTLDYLANGGSSALAFCKGVLKEEGVIKRYASDVTEQELNTEDEIPKLNLEITKATNDDLMQATFVVMVPDEVDLHGDVVSEEEVRKAKESFVKYSLKANLFHLVETDTFEFLENYVSPVDFVLGERFVKKGTWLCTIQVLDDDLWSEIKKGNICSVSIGAMARCEDLE